MCPATIPPPAARKAERLVDAGQVHPLPHAGSRVFVVHGDSGRAHLVTVTVGDDLPAHPHTSHMPPAHSCTCPGHTNTGSCAHVAAAALWRLREAGADPFEGSRKPGVE